MDMETVELPEISAEVREAARQAGGGWLDVVIGKHQGPPPTRFIKGAWRLDENGELTGEYMANPNYGRAIPISGGGCPMGYTGPRRGTGATGASEQPPADASASAS